MNADEIKKRTKAFALQIIRLADDLPKSRSANVIANQLMRSATSVGANYRSACRARSRADFIAKMGIVEEEADESVYWIELLVESGSVGDDQVSAMLAEAREIVSIAVSSIKTARRNAVAEKPRQSTTRNQQSAL